MNARLGAIIGAGALGLAAAVIMPWEGEKREAYQDIVDVTTICFGHTATAHPGMVATGEECRELLDRDMLDHLQGLERCVAGELEPHQWAALLSWTFNVGVGAACGSTLVRLVNEGAPPEKFCPELRRWVFAGGKRVQGLANRREAELALCLNTPEQSEDMTEQEVSTGDLPEWKCHKVVKAAQIVGIETLRGRQEGSLFNWRLYLDGGDGPAIERVVGGDWMTKHKPTVGGYFVEYADDYTSFSPAEAFEQGYRRI